MRPDSAVIAATLREHLSNAAGKNVYGVVDAARCVDLAFEAKIHFGVEIRSLFLPDIQPRLWNVAPYLVPIDPAGGYLENWARRWGESAGILLVSNAEEEPLYQHLREMFVVQDEQQQEFFFRFYDPRVLRTFLPTCSPVQSQKFFGPVRTFVVEDAAGEAALSFARHGAVVVAGNLDPAMRSGSAQSR